MKFENATGLSKSDKGKKMNDVIETNELYRAAFPRYRFCSVKDMINESVRVIAKIARREITHRRARSFWEGTARRIDGWEKDAIRQALEIERLRKIKEAQAVIEEDRREASELRARLAALDARLTSIDEAFHGETLAALRSQTGGLGGVYHDRKGG